METPTKRPMRFVYARYQVAGNLATDLAKKFPVILAGLQTARLTGGKYQWVIGDIGELDVDGDQLLFGRLGKTVRPAVAPGSDSSIASFDHQLPRGKKAAWSNFFIHPANAIMVLEDKPPLPAGKFLKKFKQFWESSQPAGIDFEFLKNETEIFDVISRWDRITAAKFDLVSANTRPREDFLPLDNLIKQSKAGRASFKFDGGGDGLAIENSIIQQGLSLSAAGYGGFSLKGVAEDARATLSSKSFLIANELVEADDFEILAPAVWSGMKKILMHMSQPVTNPRNCRPAGLI